jgi:DNA-binding IclR family transcriptional regulator
LAEEFAERMLRTMNEAALALMVSVGHRTGLFDAMAGMSAATSAEIASAAGLDERYVREWLAVMTTGRIVEHDGEAGTYSLPAGHAAWLTRAAGMQNLATGMQYIGLMAMVEDQIVECFRHGGGSRTRLFRGSRPSWPRTAARSTTPPSSTGRCRSCRG